MISFSGIDTILWDFDGVILDSMSVRDYGFSEVLKDYPSDKLNALLHYHRENGGLSRYVKFRYFFESILGKEISSSQVNEFADSFSSLMRKELIKKKYLIEDSVLFLKNNYTKYNMHIVSGSDEAELRFLCGELGIDIYFKSIYGSPTPKADLVKNLMSMHSYDANKVILIGDSLNDKDAADESNIHFKGYNNLYLKELFPDSYIENLSY